MRRPLALVLLAVLALGACGGGGDKEKTSSASSTTSKAKATGQAAGTPFCKKALELKNASQQADPNSAEGLKTAYEQAAQATAGLLAVAPDELKADLTAMNDATQKLLEALRKVDFDISKLPPEDQAILQDTKLQEAGARVGAYLQDDCGIDSGTAPPTTTPPE